MARLFKGKQTLREGAAVLLLSSVAVKLIGALFKIPLSSDAVLGDLGFGYFSLAYDVYSPISTLAISGIPVAVSRLVADYTASGESSLVPRAVRVSRRFFCGLGLVLSFAMLAVLLLAEYLGDLGASSYALFAVTPAFLICAEVSVWRGCFEGLHNMDCTALSSVTEALGKLIFGLSFAAVTVRITGNYAYAAAATVVGIVLGLLLSGSVLLPFKGRVTQLGSGTALNGSASLDREIRKKIILISVPIILTSLNGSAAVLIDALTVKRLLSRTISENSELLTGIYSAVFDEYRVAFGRELSVSELPTLLYGIKSKAHTLYNLIPTLTLSFGISAIPGVTEAFNRRDFVAARDGAVTVLRLSSLITFPSALGFICMGEPLMCLLYGRGSSSAVGGRLLLLYGFAVLSAGLMLPLGCVLQGMGRQRTVLFNSVSAIALKLILNIVLCSLPGVNIYGSVISTVLYCFTYCALNFAVLIKTVGGLHDIAAAIYKPFFAAVLCGITAFAVSSISDSSAVTVLAVLLSAVVYFITLTVLGAFNREDIAALPFGNKLLTGFDRLKIWLK